MSNATKNIEENMEGWKPEAGRNNMSTIVICLLVVAMVLLIGNVGVTVYSMRENKKGLKGVNNIFS